MTEEILTFKEVRQYLKISRTTLYNWLHQKKIPAAKIGRVWRFKKSKIDAWMEEQAR
ncbi:MAG: helix-turn-helix domain-containing protein [Candidatus Omnitrophica bacterium]|nr:helix-turn-helix domain-containing protein [Candidatus Omnitrophota bacterium]MCM8771444.1 helix-turn-helix domain-containing protein [Candidatus Omnitrophota bacterium]